MKILVTGGAGFIGSHLIRHLLRSTDHGIVNLDALTYAGNLGNLSEITDNVRYRFYPIDVCDYQAVNSLFKAEQITHVFHLAAATHVDRSIVASDDFIRSNVAGTHVLLEISRLFRVKRFIHISTDEVYGTISKPESATERTPLHPSSPYAASKAAADMLVMSYIRTHNLPCIITRSSNNYGPRQNIEKLIPKLIDCAIQGLPLPIYGDGQYIRDWIHVEDHCRALLALLKSGTVGEIYNIASGKLRSNLEIAKIILNNIPDSRSTIQHVADRLGHDRRYSVDCQKIRSATGWAPQNSFENEILETIQWYKRDVHTRKSSKEERIMVSTQFKHGPIHGVQTKHLLSHDDKRGNLIELYRCDELSPRLSPRMAYVSNTNPGVVRGPHEHKHQTDVFAFIGPGDFTVSMWDTRKDSSTYGNQFVLTAGESAPKQVIVPAGVVHAYRNDSNEIGRVFNAPNQLYRGNNKANEIDEIRWESTSHPFHF